jgi:hypothetical protein
VNLEQLKAQLIAMVNETMQPGHVSLWLRSQQRNTGILSKAAGSEGNGSERAKELNIHI